MMGNGTLTIYSASAGSGKTFRLAGIYLAHIFKSRHNYRKILAVTFTNKATAEMKGRILDQLYRLADGRKSEYLQELISGTGHTEEYLRKEAGEVLNAILHDFSRFSVCTIDAFFQRVIRSFARETGLHTGFNVELDHTLILSDAVDEMLASSADDPELAEWLRSYVMSRLSEEKGWNLKEGIMKLSEELFREEFKILSVDQFGRLHDKKYLHDYIAKIKELKYSYERRLENFASEALNFISEYNLSDDLFYYKSRGIPGFIRSLAAGSFKEPGKNVLKVLEDPPKWASGKVTPAMQGAIDSGLGKTIIDILAYIRNNAVNYNSSVAVLENIYALGILSDVLEKVHSVATSENSFLISDSGDLLWQITKGDQAPFIYEKIGNSFENFMIDEFQDTSKLQWQNFEPLIINSMGEGNDSLVVGDVKQSIYRFRNSDWRILRKMKDEIVDGRRFLSKPLLKNWRSRTNIIRFNNTLFTVIPGLINDSFSGTNTYFDFSAIYAEAIQDDHAHETGGYVRLEFVGNDSGDSVDPSEVDSSTSKKKWQDKVSDKLPGIFESVQKNGYKASDIGILVRTAREGARVLETMVAYGNEHKNGFNYNIVSNDSLTLSNSHAITFIIATLKVIDNPHDLVSRAEMVRFFNLASGNPDAASIPMYGESLAGGESRDMPSGYATFLERASGMSIFEATENIISFFGLGEFSWNVCYLNSFQDLVINFTSGKNGDLDSFLDWWENSGKSKSVVLPANQDAARVFTIHKSKGLEFPIVIIPFISWHTDHEPSKQPFIWVAPETAPFNDLGIVPLRYSEKLQETVFANKYMEEKYSSYLDNLNLLYVSMTRAVDAIYGFIPAKPASNNGIARYMSETLRSSSNPAGDKGFTLSANMNDEETVFELGTLPVVKRMDTGRNDMIADRYVITSRPESLKLKLHGENYFSESGEETRQKINYGKLMHEVFEKINTIDDVPDAVSKLLMEGKINAADVKSLESRINDLITSPAVSEWFSLGVEVLKEADILMLSGNTRRPDRIIIRNGRAIIIDFKFGEEKEHYFGQVGEYIELLSLMGYSGSEGYIWYVEKNKVVKV